MNRPKPLIFRISILAVGLVVAAVTMLPAPQAKAHHVTECNDVYTPLSNFVVDGVNTNKWAYVGIMNETNVPWEMLAAIHYRETSFSHTNPSNGQGIFQFVGGQGGPYPPGPVSDDEFLRQLKFMAEKLQTDYVWRGSTPRERRALQANEQNISIVKDTLFSYNGRAGVYADQAVHFGFDRTNQPYEGSPYVMNRFDCVRARMGLITKDFGSMDGIDTRYGAFTVFARLRGQWFGPEFCNFDYPSSAVSDVEFRKLRPNVDSANLLLYRGTRTNCIESHTWNAGFNTWQENTPSNHPIITRADSLVRYADLNADGKDEPMLIGLHNTGSGMIEFHIWDYTMRKWIVHGISNQPASAANIDLKFADLNGDGKDEPILIGYAGTASGMIELHYWNEGVQTWRDHVITNHPVIDPAKTLIDFADLNGDGKDEGLVIGASDTGTGKLEFHVWNPGMWSWQSHAASNQATINLTDSNILFADLDGNKTDEAVLIGKKNTGSSRIEFHVWNPGFTSWKSHDASNQPVF